MYSWFQDIVCAYVSACVTVCRLVNLPVYKLWHVLGRPTQMLIEHIVLQKVQ